MRKRICFVQPKVLAYFHPKLNIVTGGAERQIYFLTQHLKGTKELDLHICSQDLDIFPKEILKKTNLYGRRNGITLHPACKLNGNRIVEAIKLFRCICYVNADLYIFRSADLGVAVAVAMCKALGKPVLYMVAANEANHSFLKSYCGWLGAKAMSWLYNKADLLTVQSEEQNSDFKQLRKRCPDLVLPNLFVKPEFQNLEPQFDQSKGNNILWVGRCDPVKRCEIFLNLAKHHPELPFVMVCPKTSYHKYGESIKTAASKINNLTFIDLCQGEMLWNQYAKAKLLVMTSEHEGFSNVMMEAMYAKRPILTTGINPDNILHDQQAGVSCGDDLEELSQNLIRIYNDKELCLNMGLNGRAYILKKHSPENSTKLLANLIEKFFNNRSSQTE